MARTFAVDDVYLPAKAETFEAHLLDAQGPGMVGVGFTDSAGATLRFALPADMARQLAGSIVDELVALAEPSALDGGVKGGDSVAQ